MTKETMFKTIGVIIVGALGSALWDFSKPALYWLWATFTTVSSLGIQSLSDDLYIRAASQSSYRISSSYIVQGLAAVSFLIGTAHMQVISMQATSREARFYAKLHMLVLCAMMILMLVQLLRTTYSLSLAKKYDLLEMIVAPHVSEMEQKRSRAAMARVNNENDYNTVLSAMTARAVAAGEKLPTN